MNDNEYQYEQAAADYARVEEAIRYLEENFRDQPDLSTVAAQVGLSEYHFQRLFSRWAGISPKRFSQFLTLQYAKELLDESHTVLDTTYEAGLSSPGRLHDLFVTFEAVTPGEYKQQGAGLDVTYGFHPTPFGEALLAITERGICHFAFLPDGGREAALEELARNWSKSALHEDDQVTQPYVERIFRAIHNGRLEKPIPLHVKGTNFQIQVWQALLRIPAGALVSYEDVARQVCTPRATRAVGAAIGQNPVAFLIPCHRVISKAGKIGNYHWGPARKKAMLGWEAAQRDH